MNLRVWNRRSWSWLNFRLRSFGSVLHWMNLSPDESESELDWTELLLSLSLEEAIPYLIRSSLTLGFVSKTLIN